MALKFVDDDDDDDDDMLVLCVTCGQVPLYSSTPDHSLVDCVSDSFGGIVLHG